MAAALDNPLVAQTIGLQLFGFARQAAIAFAAVALIIVCFVLGLVLDSAAMLGGGQPG